MSDLALHIQQTPLMDTHEHLNKEAAYVENGPDILVDLFDNYVAADLVVAGAAPEAVRRLVDRTDPDLAGRFEGVREAWECCQHTGYGEAVRLIASRVYGIEELTSRALEANREKTLALCQPGKRREILEKEANIDHVQVDDFLWTRSPNETDADFFLYDLSWVSFCRGEVDAERILEAVGVEVRDLETLREALNTFFARFAPYAIAVKSQHAYNRTLYWEERSDADTARVLEKRLRGQELTPAEQLCLGDWCWARGVELATAHNLPFKIHTGYYAGHSRMPVSRIPSGHLCGLLARYPKARFVLMHIAYPYSDELIAIAKHYPNVWIDLCWAWSINPYHASDFVRRYIHAVPSNKLFVFGGDTFWPNAALAYSIQARQGLTRALQHEIDEDLLPEKQALALATRFMRGNQEACFDLEGTRQALRAARA